MKQPIRIAIDVDLTIVDTLDVWFDWLEMKSGIGKPFLKKVIFDEFYKSDDEYHLEKYMKKYYPEPLKFWKQPDLYDNLKPFDEFFSFLETVSNTASDYKVPIEFMFISFVFPEHCGSKMRFLQKYFPHIPVYLVKGHKDKNLIEFDVLIDDYRKLVDKFQEKIKEKGKPEHLKNNSFYTHYTAGILYETPINKKNGGGVNWSEITKFIQALIKEQAKGCEK